MQNTVEISYDALYYLAQLMQAEYMDYDYFKLVGDIETNYDLFAKQAAESLQNSGLLTEDFSGELELDETLRQIATPLFFGNAESSLDLLIQGETVSRSFYKFHFFLLFFLKNYSYILSIIRLFVKEKEPKNELF